jgi:hypothetical protein
MRILSISRSSLYFISVRSRGESDFVGVTIASKIEGADSGLSVAFLSNRYTVSRASRKFATQPHTRRPRPRHEYAARS